MSSRSGGRGSPRVAVVGAGILGAATAFQLSLRGASVVVLEAGEPGGSVTATSPGWLNAADKSPRSYHDLNRVSLEAWRRFADLVGAGKSVRWGGEVRWAATTAGAEKLRARVERHQALGYPMRLLDRSELAELAPGLEPGTVASASLAACEGQADGPAVVARCLAAALEHGAEVRTETRATGLEVAPDRAGALSVRSVVAGADEVECDVLVLAAGGGAPGLAAEAGVHLPLSDGFGAVVLTEPVEPLFERVAVLQTASDLDPRVTVRQLPDGRVMLHGLSSGVEGSLGRTEEDVERVRDTAARFLPALRGAAVSEVRRSGRPIPSDGQPVVGFPEGVRNLYVLAMHSGITLAPLVSELATLEILDGARVGLFDSCRIERFR
jgi:glycine/D-amino acid oxidase-like deaminating enzyme